MVAPPADLREAEVEIAERAADRDVGQRHVDAGAPRLGREAGGDGIERRLDLVHLALDPGLRALLAGAAGPGRLEARQDQRIDNAVGERLPGAHFGALAV